MIAHMAESVTRLAAPLLATSAANTNHIAEPSRSIDLAGIGREIYAEACLDPFAKPIHEGPFRIICRLWGHDAIRSYPPGDGPSSGCYEMKGRPFFWFRKGPPRFEGVFGIAKILARMFLERRGVMTTEHDEALASWLCAPPPVLSNEEIWHAKVAFDIERHASAFGAPPRAVVESLADPVSGFAARTVLVDETSVRCFGKPMWLSPFQLRALSKRPARSFIRRRLSATSVAMIWEKEE